MTSLHLSNSSYQIPGASGVQGAPSGSTYPPLFPATHPHQFTNQVNPQLAAPMGASSKLLAMNEQTWLKIGSLSESMSESDRALYAYETAARHNPYNTYALQRMGYFYLQQERYAQAADCFQRVLNIESHNGEAWASLALSYTWMDEYQKAYSAYQQALCCLQNPRDASVWYGIGLLYDRFGSHEQAEEAYLSALSMDPNQELLHVVYYRLGVLYMKKKRNDISLECFRFVLSKPPKSIQLTELLLQLATLHGNRVDYSAEKEALEQILLDAPNNVKALLRLAWIYMQPTSPLKNENQALATLNRASELDPNNAIPHYLLGRFYYYQKQYTKSYEAYQQAVYRDGKQSGFWCSIGILYYAIGQARDALDAYIRAIHLSSNIWEIWWNLGILYESCNNQNVDALDAYQHALDADPNNTMVKERIALLKSSPEQSNTQLPSVVDLNPWDINSSNQSSAQNTASTTPISVDTQSMHQKPRSSSGIPSAPASYPSLPYPLPSRFAMPNFPSANGGSQGPNMNHPSQYYQSQGAIQSSIPILNTRGPFNSTPQRRSVIPDIPSVSSLPGSRTNSIGPASGPPSPIKSFKNSDEMVRNLDSLKENDSYNTAERHSASIGMEQLANEAVDRG